MLGTCSASNTTQGARSHDDGSLKHDGRLAAAGMAGVACEQNMMPERDLDNTGKRYAWTVCRTGTARFK